MPGLLEASHILVIGGPSAIAVALTACLCAAGISAKVADEVQKDANGVILLHGLDTLTQWQDALHINRQAFQHARAIAEKLSEKGGLFVTVQDTGGDFGLSGNERAWVGGLSALARTAALEWPLAEVRAIDIEQEGRSAEQIAQCLVDELIAGGRDLEVALPVQGVRSTLVSQAQELKDVREADLTSESVIVVSGGARGVTASVVRALAQKHGSRFVLLGRSKLIDEPKECAGILEEAPLKRALMDAALKRGEQVTPRSLGAKANAVRISREIHANLQAIFVAGGSARYEQVDITDEESVSDCLQRVRAEWGEIHSLIHAAGILADKLIAEKTDAQFDRVFDTKVRGLKVLLDATVGDPLRSIILFSSVAARVGNRGQVDYAMANEVLNKVAALEARLRGKNTIVRALGFGPWDGGMVTPQLRARFVERGIELIPLGAGSRACAEEFGFESENAEVVIGMGADASVFLDSKPSSASTAPSAESGSSDLLFKGDILIGSERFSCLQDHVITKSPVVPLAFALEWMLRAAQTLRPELVVVEARNIQVLRGIELEHFEKQNTRIKVYVFAAPHAHESSSNHAHFQIELRDEEDCKRYSTLVTLKPSRRSIPLESTNVMVQKWPQAAYSKKGALFHGPRFKAIMHIEGVHAEGILAILRGSRALGWPQHAQVSSPALVDGALQMALTYALYSLCFRSLPSAIEIIRFYEADTCDDIVSAILWSREQSKLQGISDILLTNQGKPLVDLIGVQTHSLLQEASSTTATHRPAPEGEEITTFTHDVRARPLPLS